MAGPDDRKKDWRAYEPVPDPVKSVRRARPMNVALIGPPGSGKTRSMLRMMRGVQRVFPGPAVLIDTEAGRSSTFSPLLGHPARPDDPVEPTYDFETIDLRPPFQSNRCWAAIESALRKRATAIGFDNLSDEHIGEGGYLRLHDEEVERMGGNEWGAWGRPAALRQRLITGMLHLSVPPVCFYTFVAEEKTAQVEIPDEGRPGRKKKAIIQKGWTPVAPILILKAMDLTCILPWDSKGTPIWEARGLPFEDFVRKWPDHLVRLLKQGQITEAHGEALARWAKGEDVAAAGAPSGGAPAQPPAEPQARVDRRAQLAQVGNLLEKHCGSNNPQRSGALQAAFGTDKKGALEKMPDEAFAVGLAALRQQLEGLAAMKSAARQSPEPDSQDWPPPEEDHRPTLFDPPDEPPAREPGMEED